MRRMLLIPVEGAMAMVEAPSFESMRRTLGGYLERVRVGAEWAIAVDEEGLLKQLPVNERASLLYGFARHGVPICGPALLGREGFVGDGVDWLDTNEAAARQFVNERLAAS